MLLKSDNIKSLKIYAKCPKIAYILRSQPIIIPAGNWVVFVYTSRIVL